MFSLLLIIFGLIICFYSIYIQKVIQAIIGFFSGLILGLIINAMLMLSAGNFSLFSLAMLSEEDSARFYIITLVAALVFSFLSIKLESLIWAIQAAIFVFVVVCLVFLLFVDMALGDIIGWMFLIALIASIAAAWFMFIYYRYAFIILTALYGGVMASIGIVSLMNGGDLYRLLSGENIALCFVIALVLTCCGFSNQRRILLQIESKGVSISKPSDSRTQMSSADSIFDKASKLKNVSYLSELLENKVSAILIFFGLVLEPIMREFGTYYFAYQNNMYIILEMIGLAAFVYIGIKCRDMILFAYATPYLVISLVKKLSYFTYNAVYAFNSIIFIVAVSLIVLAAKKYVHTDLNYFVAGCGTVLYRFVTEHLVQLHNGYELWWRPSFMEVLSDFIFIIVFTILVYKFEGINVWNITRYTQKGIREDRKVVISFLGIFVIISLCICGSETYRFVKMHIVNKPEPYSIRGSEGEEVTEREELFLRSVLAAIDFRGEWKCFDSATELSDGDRTDVLLNAKDIDDYIDDTECFMPTGLQESNFTIRHKDLEEASENIWGIEYDKDASYNDLYEKYDYGWISSNGEGLYKASAYEGVTKDEIYIYDITYDGDEITINYTEDFYYTDGEHYMSLDRVAIVSRTGNEHYPFRIISVQGDPYSNVISEQLPRSEWRTVYDAYDYTAAIDQGLVGGWDVYYYENDYDEEESDRWAIELFDDYTGVKYYDGEEYYFTWKTEGDFELTFHHQETDNDEVYSNCMLIQEGYFETYPKYGGYCIYSKYY